MKFLSLLPFLFLVSISFGQTLPIDFEGSITTADFVDFDGGIATVIPNPQSSGINTSATVAQIVRNGGEPWSGSKIILANNLDFSTNSIISMKVFTTTPIGTIVKFKLEGNGQTEVDATTTVNNEWETLTWDFTGQPANFNEVVFMFDFGNVGDGSATSTFLFDDVEQLYAGEQIDLPVDFESTTVNYTTTDFGGNNSSLVVDPTDNTNMVVQAIKTDGAATWAGTTIGTSGGFASNIPLTLDDSKMTVRVWSPDAGTPIRLKVENSNDPTQTCETEVNTTVAAGWEILEFDFVNQASGTAALSFGLTNGWTYNMASIFFNFGTEGATAGEKTYYFDNVAFGDFILDVKNITREEIKVFPNPTNSQWIISSENSKINLVEIFNAEGKLVFSIFPKNKMTTMDASNFPIGIYFSKIITDQETSFLKLIKN